MHVRTNVFKLHQLGYAVSASLTSEPFEHLLKVQSCKLKSTDK